MDLASVAHKEEKAVEEEAEEEHLLLLAPAAPLEAADPRVLPES